MWPMRPTGRVHSLAVWGNCRGNRCPDRKTNSSQIEISRSLATLAARAATGRAARIGL